jgi:hypothetical protein
MRLSRATVLVLCAGFAACGGGDDGERAERTPAPTPVATPDTTANLWIDANGGECVRQETAGPHDEAQACASFDAAYEAASCGDLVRVQGGRYDAQEIDAAPKDCGESYVTITPAAGDTVTVGRRGAPGTVQVTRGSWIRFAGPGLEVVDGGERAGAGFYLGPTGMGKAENVHHVRVERASFETLLVRGADDITFTGNDIAPGKSEHWDEKNWVSVGNDGIEYVDNYPSRIVIEDNDIHGFTEERCSVEGCHVECLVVEAEDVTITGNDIRDCDIYALVFSSSGGFSTRGAGNVVEGNRIECCANAGSRAIGFGETEKGSVVRLSHNTLVGTVGYEGEPSLVQELRFEANVIAANAFPDCLADEDITMTENVIAGGDLCGETNTTRPEGATQDAGAPLP